MARAPHLSAAALALLSAAALPGCDGRDFKFAGVSLYKYFPLDGEREWIYANESADIGSELHVRTVGSRRAGDVSVVTLRYSTTNPDLELFDVEWSSDSVDGIQIWSWTDAATGAQTVFNPPLLFADGEMTADQAVSSSGGGFNCTSTYLELVELGNAWTTDTWESAHIYFDDGDGDDMAGLPFAGHWWIASTYGTNQLVPTGYVANTFGFDPGADSPSGENWYLSKANFATAED